MVPRVAIDHFVRHKPQVKSVRFSPIIITTLAATTKKDIIINIIIIFNAQKYHECCYEELGKPLPLYL